MSSIKLPGFQGLPSWMGSFNIIDRSAVKGPLANGRFFITHLLEKKYGLNVSSVVMKHIVFDGSLYRRNKANVLFVGSMFQYLDHVDELLLDPCLGFSCHLLRQQWNT